MRMLLCIKCGGGTQWPRRVGGGQVIQESNHAAAVSGVRESARQRREGDRRSLNASRHRTSEYVKSYDLIMHAEHGRGCQIYYLVP
jgi:hypothetical protein